MCTFIQKRLRCRTVQITNKQIYTISKKTAGQFAANITKSDKSDTCHQIFPPPPLFVFEEKLNSLIGQKAMQKIPVGTRWL